ncbi:hybrid sensor histidine kinase/response regulator [Bacteroidia bacterium]|nr:hybrid sensor histidine kinase/response regulator [Bacteroidia bacterium]
MQNLNLLYILSILLAILFQTLDAQTSITPIPLINQLPSNSVSRVFQDSKGFIWFGTLDGLCRYDAYRILTFRSDLNNSDLLTNNEITCLTEDKTGHLIIGTKEGVNILDQRTYRIVPLQDDDIRNEEIKSITVSSDSSVWIGTTNHLFRYGSDNSRNKRYDSSIPPSSINSIFEDNHGDLWVAVWHEGLYKYDASIDSFIRFPKIGTLDNPFNLFQDDRNQLWICTWGDGLYRFNPNKDGDQMYIRQPLFSKERNLPETVFFSMVQDNSDHLLWVMSISGMNALAYTPEENLKEVDVSPLFAESNNIFSEIVKDKEGTMWIAAFSEGVLTINFDKPVIENYLIPSIKQITGISPNITAVFKDTDDLIWLNQNRWGLGWYNPSTNNIRFYNETPSLKDLSELGTVSYISGFRSIPDVIWVAPENESAIYCFRKQKDDILLSSRIDLTRIGDTAGNPRIFYEDRKNNIWIATTGGLLIKRFNSEEIEPLSLPLGSITGITEDTRGAIWISSGNTGLYRINSVGKLSVENFNKENASFPGNNISTICADLNGNVWIGTKEGRLMMYDCIKQTFQDLSRSLQMPGESILNIVADDYGHIWFSTNKRITEYNPVNASSRDYTETDGMVVTSFFTNSYFKEKSGQLLFGGNKGITLFTPSEALSKETKQTKAIISDIKINTRSVFDTNDNSQFDIIGQIVHLEPEDKNIEIDFSSLNYIFPSKIRYAYKMGGIDNDWIYAENDRQFAIYNQLKKGSYTFYIRTTDENNRWSEEITRLRIIKRPAFYETAWAYVFYFTLAILTILLISRTIRNRVKLQHALQIAQIEKDKSEELTQTKLRYFTNISHDFLTPLTIISCLIDDVEDDLKGKSHQVGTIRSNISRLRRLLQQVLDFRKIESGNMQLQLSEGDIALFIKDSCYSNFLPLMKKKDIHFSFTAVPAQIPACFDADKIEKIVFNILSNAFKYTPSGGEVKIELLKQDTYLSIRISDTGTGISKKDLSQIFTRFYNNRMQGGVESNGIGLSLVKDLVNLHQGSIRVESEIGKGTLFTIDIPLAPTGDTGLTKIKQSETMAVADERDATSHISTDQTTVLIVEDNEDLRTVIQSILSKHYHVLTAQNGAEALPVIKENNIDIIISDVMMPEMDGLELCQLLKADLETSHIPIILLTARNSTEDRIACYNAGADGYISKPFEMKLLEARINNFLVNKKSKQKEFKEAAEINISTLAYPKLDEQFLSNAIRTIEAHLSETDFDVNLFAESLCMSKSSLYRKIKTMTDLSPIEFIRNIRLKHACSMLKDPAIPISEVAYALGFSDSKYFATCFKNEFNLTPSEYQKQFRFL